jgi:alpha-galactosidase
MTTHPDARIVLRAAGVCLILDATAGRLPAVLHWGGDPGVPSAADLDALALGAVAPLAPNGVDEPVRVSLLPEHWTGWTGTPGLRGSRAGGAWSPRFTTIEIEVDGVAVAAEGSLVLREGASRVVFRAEDAVAELELGIEIEMDASGVLRLRGSVRNLDEDDYQLDELLLALPVPQEAGELLDFGGRWGKERVPQRAPITLGTHRREGRHGRTGADSAYLLHAGTPGFDFARGELWALHTGWSGNHVHQFERVDSGVQLLAGGELLLPGELRLRQGETYRGPWIYAAYGDEGLDEVARRFHTLLRGRPQHPRTPRPVTLNVWEAVYFDHDQDVLIELAEQAAAVGIERFVLDDGWFGARRDDRRGLGDWTVSPEAWPDGLHPLVDRVRKLGMQFGLWFEPEMVNLDSDLARQHPEWILSTDGRLPVESRHQQVLDLAVPGCYAYLRDAICAIFDEYEIGYIKWDHNRDLIDAGGLDGRPAVHEQTLAFYRLVDEIKARCPGLEIESCSSGGARVDLGVLERTERIWVSDNIDPLDRQQMLRWTTQLVPPEMMGAHIASDSSHTTGRKHDLSFRAATALFGHLGVEWDLRAATAAERMELADWIRFHKEHRALLHSGDLLRMDHPDPSIILHGVIAPDRSEAIYSYAVTARSPYVSPGRIRLPGLAPERRYRIEPVFPEYLPPDTQPPAWWPATELTGALLATAGLTAPLLRPEHAVLYHAQLAG